MTRASSPDNADNAHDGGRAAPPEVERHGDVRRKLGGVRYTDDIQLPGMLHAKILRCPHPHARIRGIDASRALAMDGVYAVVTGKDMPRRFGIIPWTPDEYPLCVDRVRYVGDGVAAVAAVDEDTALRALERIEVEYDVLPAHLDPFEALQSSGSYEDGSFIHPPRREGWNGNVTKKVRLEFGEVDALLEASDVVVEGAYFFEGTTHAAIEPHCAIGLWEPDGGGPDGGGPEGGGPVGAEARGAGPGRTGAERAPASAGSGRLMRLC